MNAITELFQTVREAWEAADLGARLKAWWWVLTHRAELDRSGGWLQ